MAEGAAFAFNFQPGGADGADGERDADGEECYEDADDGDDGDGFQYVAPSEEVPFRAAAAAAVRRASWGGHRMGPMHACLRHPSIMRPVLRPFAPTPTRTQATTADKVESISVAGELTLLKVRWSAMRVRPPARPPLLGCSEWGPTGLGRHPRPQRRPSPPHPAAPRGE